MKMLIGYDLNNNNKIISQQEDMFKQQEYTIIVSNHLALMSII